MNNKITYKILRLVILLILSVFTAGLKGGGGCSCGDSSDQTVLELPEAPIAGSDTYRLSRGEIGASFFSGISSSEDYKATSGLGYFLSQGVQLSDRYKTFHPMSKDVLEVSDALAALLAEVGGPVANITGEAFKESD